MSVFFKKMSAAVLIPVMLLINCPGLQADASANGTLNKIQLNENVLTLPSNLPIIQNEIFVPFRWITKQMGAEKLTVDNKNNPDTLTIEIPSFLKQHQYLSYLNGLQNVENDPAYLLPEKLQHLQLPPYPLKNLDMPMLHKHPLTLNITSNQFETSYAIYDYQFINHQLYVGSSWLNTLFLAQLTPDYKNHLLKIDYPVKDSLEKQTADLENLFVFEKPEDVIALWIRGQQKRSGALQYSVLSPELKTKALSFVNEGGGWVTGGSSPSLGKAEIVGSQKTSDGISYTLQFEELLQGTVNKKLTQEIHVKKYQDKTPAYWLIDKVSGDTDYYTLLPFNNASNTR